MTMDKAIHHSYLHDDDDDDITAGILKSGGQIINQMGDNMEQCGTPYWAVLFAIDKKTVGKENSLRRSLQKNFWQSPWTGLK